MLQLIAARIINLLVKKCNNGELDLKWKFNRELVEVEVAECTDENESAAVLKMSMKMPLMMVLEMSMSR